MMAAKPTRPEHQGQWTQAGLALSIPTMMLAGPLVGFLIAWVLNYFFHFPAPWLGRVKIIAVILSTIAAMREVFKIIKKIS